MNLRLTTMAAAAVMLSATVAPAFAADTPPTRIIDENFEYPVGNLYQQGGWVKYGPNAAAPVQVVAGSQVYQGYIDAETGNQVALSDTKSGEDMMRLFSETYTSGSLYASFLLNVESAPTSTPGYFFSFASQSTAGLADGKSSSEYGRLFAKQSSETTYTLSATMGKAYKEQSWSPEMEYGKTYLVVLKYDIVEGTANDVVSVWVNPATDGTEPAAAYVHATNGGDCGAKGLCAVELRQGTTDRATCPNLKIDALRVARSWSDLFDASETPVEHPVISVNPAYHFENMLFEGKDATFDAVIAGSALTGDVTISCPAWVTVSESTLTPAQVEGEGYKVTFTITPSPAASGEWKDKITITSPGAEDKYIEVGSDMVIKPVALANASRIQPSYDSEGAYVSVYRYTGKAVVTFVEQAEQWGQKYAKIYAQDMFGAFCLNTSYSDMAADAIRVGDEITNFLCQISDESAVGLELMLFSMEGEQLGGITITDTQKYKTPVDINLADYVPADNQYKLVRLQGVQFSTSGTFAADSYAVTVGDASARIHPFPNTDVIGSEIPATADVVGISMSKGAVVVWPRSLGDIQAAAPSVEVAATPLFDFSETAAPINKDTEIVKYTVTYSGIKAEAPISITGANRDMFSVAPAAIPAGSGTVDLIVTYHPTSTGKHSANLYFDFDGTSAELNRTISIKGCMAYDPENLPVLSLDPASLELRADVGATVTGTVTLNVANAFDYINVKRGSETATGVSINSTLFLPSLDKQTVTITFAPKAEGDVTETFTFSTMMGNPVVLTVKGFTGEPAQPEPTEGGKLELNPADAYSNYYQDFQDVVTNKPLDIPGWCNVAEEGTRAWWGYVGEDFTAAKVTAYDSSVEVGKGTPCRMLLVSPALDYLGAPYKNLSFRLMGKGLYEGMTDQLEICLIELPATRAAEPVITPMQGFNIPVTPDEDSQWIPYEVQMSAIEDMPDVFWIGFRFTSERGRDNAAQYFMTDFSWGAAPTGIGNIYDNADGRYRVYNLQGVLLLDTDDATALDRLPRGLYIVNGKKILK